MRLVQVTIPAGKRETVLSALDEQGVDYVVSDETSDRAYAAVVSVPLPTAGVEPVLEAMRDAGVERDAYTVVLAAETVESEQFDRLVERYEADTDEDTERIAREELRARAQDLAPSLPSFVLLTVVSALVATAGLLSDSPATVVGSMVIAPLIGPAMALGVGTVLDETDLTRRGVRLQAVGVVLTVAAAAVFAALVRFGGVVPPGLDVVAVDEVSERIAPDVLTLPIALGAGVAGAHSLRSGVSTALVGVMIAVALVPPAAVVGIGIAWGLPTVVLGATVLVSVNVLSINLAVLATLWYSGYRPDRLFRTDEARATTLSRVAVLTIAIGLLAMVLAGVTLVAHEQGTAEQTVDDTAHAAVADLDGVEVVSTSVTFTPVDPRVDRLFDPDIRHVTVTVTRSTDARTAGLADRLAARLAAATGDDLTVELRYVAVDRGTSDAEAAVDAVAPRAAVG